MLDTHFPRPLGDIGNPATWPFPVCYGVVPGARVARVVASEADPALLEPFIATAEKLIQAGAQVLSTSCGFLVLFQAALSARLPVPVLSSSLLQIPWLQALGRRRVGVITIDARRLSEAHLRAAGAALDTPVVGLEGGELHRVICEDLPQLDTQRAEAELIAAADQLRARVPDLDAVVLECTNLPPYSGALRRHLGLPVYDITTAVHWLCLGLTPD